MTYLTQLTHQNVTHCCSPEGATLTISIMVDEILPINSMIA